MARCTRLTSILLPAALVACSGETETPSTSGGAAADVATPADAPPAKAPAEPAAKAAPEPTPLPEGANPALTDPALATATAPDTFSVRFETTKGPFVVEVHRDWSPNGADRFYNLVQIGWFTDAKFFRNIEGFMVQFGMSPYPAASKVWMEATIADDPVVKSNEPLMVTFAKTGKPDSRSTQVFINHGNNANLDGMGFSPFGTVTEGAEVVKALYTGYGEGAPRGRGPRQDIIARFGNVYLDAEFPKLDGIESATVLP